MIGSIADINIQIGSSVFRLKDLQGKTLYAAKQLPVYNSYLSAKPSSTIEKNEVAGIVQGFVQKGYKGAKQNYFLIGPNTALIKAIPYDQSSFSANKLQDQGVKTYNEMVKDQESEDKPWYAKIISNIGPWVIGGIAVYTLIKKKL